MIRRAERNKAGCADCAEHRCSVWSDLDTEELLHHSESLRILHFIPDEEVFRVGERCRGLYCIREGLVALCRANAQGDRVITRLVHAGETLGCRTFFAGGGYQAMAVALTSCTLCFIERAPLHALLERNPALTRRFLRYLARTLLRAESAGFEQVVLPMRARLAHLLLDLADRYGRDAPGGGLSLELPMSRRDLAALIGVRPESIARVLRALGEDGVVRIRGRRVEIPSLDALAAEFPHSLA